MKLLLDLVARPLDLPTLKARPLLVSRKPVTPRLSAFSPSIPLRTINLISRPFPLRPHFDS